MLAEKSDDHESRELFLFSNKICFVDKIRIFENEDYNSPLTIKKEKSDLVYSFDCYNTIRACKINGEDPALVDVATIPEDVYDQDVYSADIVGLDDGERKQLLVIIKEGVFNDGQSPETYKTKSLQVLAYDLESGNWSKVKDFGRKTLFVGFSSSFWTEDTTGLAQWGIISCGCGKFFWPLKAKTYTRRRSIRVVVALFDSRDCVCKSWPLAAGRTYHNYSNGPSSRFPSLMLSVESESEDDKESRELFLLSNKSIRKI
nr:hypothetical protein [Tanacetum cinerariifolium]